MLDAKTGLLAVWRRQQRVRPKNRWTNDRNRSRLPCERPTICKLKDRACHSTVSHDLFESSAVLLDRAIQEREDVSIEEDPVTSADDPGIRRTICQPDSGAEV